MSQQVASSSANRVVADSGQGGSRTASINILKPNDGGFKTQSIVHRWVAQDATAYQVTLSTGGQNLVAVTLLPQSGQTEAVFDNLKLNTTYTVTVVAMGNVGGDPSQPTQQINSQTPAVGTILFSGTNDVENSQSITIQVTLDSVEFDGSATTSLSTSDGSYTNPTQSEGGFVPGVPSPSPTGVALFRRRPSSAC